MFNHYDDNYLIELIQESNEEAFGILLEKYMPLICSRAMKSRGIGPYDEMLQEVRIAFTKAVMHYKLNSNVSFTYYLTICIDARLKSLYRSCMTYKNQMYKDAISYEDEVIENGIVNEESVEDYFIRKYDLEEKINRLFKMLTPLEKQVINLYIKGYDFSETCIKLGIDKSCRKNAMHRVRKKAQSIK